MGSTGARPRRVNQAGIACSSRLIGASAIVSVLSSGCLGRWRVYLEALPKATLRGAFIERCVKRESLARSPDRMLAFTTAAVGDRRLESTWTSGPCAGNGSRGAKREG